MTGSARTLLAAALTVAGCGEHETWFTTEVEIVRVSPVDRGATGTTTSIDVEIRYLECPGEQIEVVRGGPEFVTCMAQHEAGAKVPAKIHAGTQSGHLRASVHQLGECTRPIDEADEVSFKRIRECEPLEVNGVVTGFRCDYEGGDQLVKACPWFARH